MGVGDGLRAVANEAHAGRVLRSVDELRDSANAGREADANGHPEDLFRELRRSFEEHRAAGHRTVLVTGGLDLFAAPLAPLFDDVVASSMEARDGVLTGYLSTPPLVDEARAQWLKDYASRGGFDLSRSHGYGDSISDASWLSLLGRPVAVNPDLPLYRVASKAYWPIEDWKVG